MKNIEELREHPRVQAVEGLPIFESTPCPGGTLNDISIGGASVSVCPKSAPPGEPLTVGQTLILSLSDTAKMPCRVVRVFEDGFAAKFDFSVPVTR